MKSLVIIKVGDAFSNISEKFGDFEQWIVNGLGDHHLPIVITDPRLGDAFPNIDCVAGIIITGSHSMVSDREPWSENLAIWLRAAVIENTPTLGICYGHQLLAHAFGGDVGYHPDGIELGTVSINLTPLAKSDPLFSHLPDQFLAHVVHSQCVRSLPKRAVILASNAFEPHHAFRIGDFAWGVQFHPEFGTDAMAGYIEETMKNLNSDEAISKFPSIKVFATVEASSVLPKFVQLVKQRMRCSPAVGNGR